MNDQSLQRADITGVRSGRLVAVKEINATLWECRCDCGTARSVRKSHITGGTTKSCGCLRAEVGKRSRTHGFYGSRVHTAWTGMFRRCNAKLGSHDYDLYVARGIAICERWKSFPNFLADMGEPPAGMSLDRFPNNDGNYEPQNCRWATARQQAQNTHTNREITINGETLCLREWERRLGLREGLMGERLRRGWPVCRLTLPPTSKGPR